MDTTVTVFYDLIISQAISLSDKLQTFSVKTDNASSWNHYCLNWWKKGENFFGQEPLDTPPSLPSEQFVLCHLHVGKSPWTPPPLLPSVRENCLVPSTCGKEPLDTPPPLPPSVRANCLVPSTCGQEPLDTPLPSPLLPSVRANCLVPSTRGQEPLDTPLPPPP